MVVSWLGLCFFCAPLHLLLHAGHTFPLYDKGHKEPLLRANYGSVMLIQNKMHTNTS